MNRSRSFCLLTLALTTLLVGPGCGEQPDENRPLGEIRTEAQTMDAGKLRRTAVAYKEAIESRVGELNTLKEQFKKIPPLELMGEEAKQLKKEIEAVTASVKALRERFEVYFDKLKQADGDLSGLP